MFVSSSVLSPVLLPPYHNRKVPFTLAVVLDRNQRLFSALDIKLKSRHAGSLQFGLVVSNV
jgi:hypothetical protein